MFASIHKMLTAMALDVVSIVLVKLLFSYTCITVCMLKMLFLMSNDIVMLIKINRNKIDGHVDPSHLNHFKLKSVCCRMETFEAFVSNITLLVLLVNNSF